MAWLGCVASALALGIDLAGCSSSGDNAPLVVVDDAGVPRKDGGIVDVPDGGTADAGPSPVSASCQKYCDLVMGSCAGDQAQYDSLDECQAFCAAFPTGDAGDQQSSSLACRQYYAGTPSMTDPIRYCLSAGPYGGGVCGDRCAAYCQVAVVACPAVPYASYPDCETACTDYPYEDGGVDAGQNDGIDGPSSGNTLNCRLYQLRQILTGDQGCAALSPDGGACQ